MPSQVLGSSSRHCSAHLRDLPLYFFIKWKSEMRQPRHLNWKSLFTTSEIKTKSTISERFCVFHTATHAQSCNLENVTATLTEATGSSRWKSPFVYLTQRGCSPDFSDKPISSCCSSPSLPPPHLSRCHGAFSSLCVCDQSGAHHHSVAGRCGFSPQTSSQRVRALSCHVISRPVWKQRGRWQGKGTTGLTHATRGSAAV